MADIDDAELHYALRMVELHQRVSQLPKTLVLTESCRKENDEGDTVPDQMTFYEQVLLRQRALHVLNENFHKKIEVIEVKLKHLTHDDKQQTVDNMIGEISKLLSIKNTDKKHMAATKIQSVFRMSKSFYDGFANKIIRVWRRYSTIMKVRLSIMVAMRCPKCEQIIPAETHAPEPRCWKPTLKNRFPCVLCGAFIRPSPIIPELPFTDPLFSNTTDLGVKATLTNIGFSDFEADCIAEKVRPVYGSLWTNKDFDSLLAHPDRFAAGIRMRASIRLSSEQMGKLSALPVFGLVETRKETSVSGNQRKLSEPDVIHVPMSSAHKLDSIAQKGEPESRDLLAVKDSVVNITLMSAIGLREACISCVYVEVNSIVSHVSAPNSGNKITTSPKWNEEVSISMKKATKVVLHVYSTNGNRLGSAKFTMDRKKPQSENGVRLQTLPMFEPSSGAQNVNGESPPCGFLIVDVHFDSELEALQPGDMVEFLEGRQPKSGKQVTEETFISAVILNSEHSAKGTFYEVLSLDGVTYRIHSSQLRLEVEDKIRKDKERKEERKIAITKIKYSTLLQDAMNQFVDEASKQHMKVRTVKSFKSAVNVVLARNKFSDTEGHRNRIERADSYSIWKDAADKGALYLKVHDEKSKRKETMRMIASQERLRRHRKKIENKNLARYFQIHKEKHKTKYKKAAVKGLLEGRKRTKRSQRIDFLSDLMGPIRESASKRKKRREEWASVASLVAKKSHHRMVQKNADIVRAQQRKKGPALFAEMSSRTEAVRKSRVKHEEHKRIFAHQIMPVAIHASKNRSKRMKERRDRMSEGLSKIRPMEKNIVSAVQGLQARVAQNQNKKNRLKVLSKFAAQDGISRIRRRKKMFAMKRKATKVLSNVNSVISFAKADRDERVSDRKRYFGFFKSKVLGQMLTEKNMQDTFSKVLKVQPASDSSIKGLSSTVVYDNLDQWNNHEQSMTALAPLNVVALLPENEIRMHSAAVIQRSYRAYKAKIAFASIGEVIKASKEKSLATSEETSDLPAQGLEVDNEAGVIDKGSIENYLDFIWITYDTDNSGDLNPNEAKLLIEEITGNDNIDIEEIKLLASQMDANGNGLIDRTELINFIETGVKLSAEQKKEYSERGPLQAIMVQFFNGIESKMVAFQKEAPPTILKKEDVAEKEKNINSFLDSIWERFDTGNKGSLDSADLQRLFVHFSNSEISHDDCAAFLSQIDTNGDSMINQNELSNFIAYGFHLSDSQRKEYASRGQMQFTIVAFFDGVDKEIASREEASTVEEPIALPPKTEVGDLTSVTGDVEKSELVTVEAAPKENDKAQINFTSFPINSHVRATHEHFGGDYYEGHVLEQDSQTGECQVVFDDDFEIYNCTVGDVESANWSPASTDNFAVGDRVTATLFEWEGQFYNGEILSQDPKTGWYTIAFDDGEYHVCSPFLTDSEDHEDHKWHHGDHEEDQEGEHNELNEG